MPSVHAPHRFTIAASDQSLVNALQCKVDQKTKPSGATQQQCEVDFSLGPLCSFT